MTAQEIEEMEAIIDVFSMDGWKYIVQDLNKARVAYLQNLHYDCKTNDEYQVRRGSLLELDRWLAYEDNVRQIYDDNEMGSDSAPDNEDK